MLDIIQFCALVGENVILKLRRNLRSTGVIAREYLFYFPIYSLYRRVNTLYMHITMVFFFLSFFFYDRAFMVRHLCIKDVSIIILDVGASASRAIYRSRYIATIYSAIARKRIEAARQRRKKNTLKYMGKAQRMNSWPAAAMFDNVALYIANNGRRPCTRREIRSPPSTYGHLGYASKYYTYTLWGSITTYEPVHIL